jgi:SAM-dependent methyltransferase
MFFQDRARAIRQMIRVLRPGGRLAVAVWGLARPDARLRGLRVPAGAALREGDGGGSPVAVRAGGHSGTAESLSGCWRAGCPHRHARRLGVKGWTAADLIDEAGHKRPSCRGRARPALLRPRRRHRRLRLARPHRHRHQASRRHVVSERSSHTRRRSPPDDRRSRGLAWSLGLALTLRVGEG